MELFCQHVFDAGQSSSNEAFLILSTTKSLKIMLFSRIFEDFQDENTLKLTHKKQNQNLLRLLLQQEGF